MRQAWFVLYLGFSLVDGQRINASCECGVAGKNRRIVGGTTVQPHQYPWLVALMLGPKLHCGGAIITDLHILTAGHCITFGVHFRDLAVYIGMHDRLDASYAVFRVVNGVKHPKFTSNAVRDINDIAVLTLDKRIKFSDKVRPICLPKEELHFKSMPLTVAGWGKTRQGALTSSRYLLETKVQIIEPEKCQKSSIYKDNLVADTMMCAYNREKDACQGDSGGPLFATHPHTRNNKWYQVGCPFCGHLFCGFISPHERQCLQKKLSNNDLTSKAVFCLPVNVDVECCGLDSIVSWGIDCAKPDYPGVYTVVSKYISWIKQQIRDGMSCM